MSDEDKFESDGGPVDEAEAGRRNDEERNDRVGQEINERAKDRARIMNDAIDITEAKAKLSDLAAHMPGTDPFMCAFAKGLADRLNDRMVPEGVNLAAELLLHDCLRGKSGFSTPIPSSLTGMPLMFYGIVDMNLPSVVKATFPADFAARYVEVRSAIRAMVAG